MLQLGALRLNAKGWGRFEIWNVFLPVHSRRGFRCSELSIIRGLALARAHLLADRLFFLLPLMLDYALAKVKQLVLHRKTVTILALKLALHLHFACLPSRPRRMLALRMVIAFKNFNLSLNLYLFLNVFLDLFDERVVLALLADVREIVVYLLVSEPVLLNRAKTRRTVMIALDLYRSSSSRIYL